MLARSLVCAAPRGGTRAASEQKDDGQEDDLEQNTHEAIGDKSATEVDHVREGLEEPLLGIARNQGAGFMAPDRQTVAGQERTGLRIAGRGDPGEDVVAAGDLVHHPILQPEHVRESAVDARSRRADTLQGRVDAVDHGSGAADCAAASRVADQVARIPLTCSTCRSSSVARVVSVSLHAASLERITRHRSVRFARAFADGSDPSVCVVPTTRRRIQSSAAASWLSISWTSASSGLCSAVRTRIATCSARWAISGTGIGAIGSATDCAC